MGIRISGSKTFPTGEGGEPGENRGSPNPPHPSLTPQLRHNRTIFSKTVPSNDSLGHQGHGGYIIAQEGI